MHPLLCSIGFPGYMRVFSRILQYNYGVKTVVLETVKYRVIPNELNANKNALISTWGLQEYGEKTNL